MAIAQIEKFDLVVANVLQHLLVTFPQPVHLQADSADYQTVYPEGNSWDGAGYVAASAEEFLFTSCVRWLSDEGFVRFSKELPASFEGAVLTHQGLNLVSGNPASLTRERYIND